MLKPSHFPDPLLRWFGWGVFGLLFSAIVYLFYLGGYRHLLVDESNSFAIELTMRILDANKDAKLLVLGNSTVAEGFRASSYNKATSPQTSLNLGIPSGHFFVFEKVVALALARGFKPRAVLLVLTPETLSLRPGYDLLQNDMTLMKTELDASDYARIWRHTSSPDSFVEHAGGLWFRPTLYTADVRDLVSNLVPRARKILITQQWLKTAGNDPEALETDNKYSVCEAGPLRDLEKSMAAERAIAGSPRLADLERVWSGYAVRVHQPLAVDGFQTQRLEDLLKHLSSRVPRVYVAYAPFYDPDFDAYPAEYRKAFSDAVADVSARASVTLLPEFDADCSMFFDTVHLNHAGGDKFTEFLRIQIGNN